ARPWPYGGHATAHSDDGWIRIERCHAAEPVRLGQSIIVQERDDLSSRDPQARVARGRESPDPTICNGSYVGGCIRYALFQVWIVIDDGDDLTRLKVLSANGIERRPQAVPPPHRIRADDNRDRRLLHHSPGIEEECTAFAC